MKTVIHNGKYSRYITLVVPHIIFCIYHSSWIYFQWVSVNLHSAQILHYTFLYLLMRKYIAAQIGNVSDSFWVIEMISNLTT